MTHSCVWHDSSICVTWLIHMCDMTHSYECQDSSICDTTQFPGGREKKRHQCYWYMWHDSFIWVPWLINMCDTTQFPGSRQERDTSATDMCDMTHSYECHDSSICDTAQFPGGREERDTSATDMCDMTLSYACHESCIFGTWLVFPGAGKKETPVLLICRSGKRTLDAAHHLEKVSEPVTWLI